MVELLLVAMLGGCSSSGGDVPLGPAGSGTGGSGDPNPGAGGTGIVLPPGGGASGMTNGGAGGGECNPQPIGLLRDFKAEHPDFEYVISDDKGLVAPDLGPTKKPVFAGTDHPTVHTAVEFDQWYTDAPGTNLTTEFQLPFSTAANGNLVYDNQNFFPLDGQGFGNENNRHNFHFTFELHMEFRYRGGEIFNFRGDDDVFVFVNNKLAIDVGGVHSAEDWQLDLDQAASALGISAGNIYPIDFFQAERHTSQSSFRIETSLAFSNCTPIIVR
jgi:fibro-slime domain-containing protein